LTNVHNKVLSQQQGTHFID